MKRMKKIWIPFLLVVAAIFSILGFAGCKENDEPKESKRLEYELNSLGDAYSVVGIGHCTDSQIVIPREHSDLPVQEIGNSAFANCADITSISIPDSVTTLGSSVFSNCTSLTSVNIPNSITEIRDSVFSNCTNLTSISIPDSVTTLGSSVFSNCTNLTSVTIPDSVTTIGGSTFYNCTSLTSINIPDSVTTIWDTAFYRCINLKNIVLPNSMKFIGYNAFDGCYRLVEIYNQSSLNIVAGSSDYGKIGYYAKAIHTQPYTSKVSADENGYVLYTDDDAVSLIAYKGKESDLNLPATVKEIHYGAFVDCSNLTSVSIPDTVTSIQGWSFVNCSNLTSVSIPNGITVLKEGTFENCSSLQNVTIPDSILSIENNTFHNCDSLVYNVKNNLNYLGNDGNPYLYLAGARFSVGTSAEIDTNCKLIGNSTFANSRYLMAITIPDNVISIGNEAFSSCSSLTSITIPDSVISIGDRAFYSCSSLTSVTLSGNVTSIANGAFSYCSSLTSITIPESVISIGDRAFYNCSSLTSVTIPEGVISIGEKAFYDCAKLVEVYNKSSLSITIHSSSNGYVGYYAKNIYTPTNGESKLTTDENGYIIYTDETTTTLMSYVGDETDLILPNGVTHIFPKAFYDYDYLISVIIPNSVTEIGDSAFKDCWRLTSVTLGNGMTTIKEYAFLSCNIKSVYIMNIETWCNVTGLNYLMGYNSNGIKLYLQNQLVTELIIPETVTCIKDSAFRNCNKLTSITLHSGITSIKSNAFRCCDSLINITFNGTVEEWYAIEKGFDWNGSYAEGKIPATEVVCSDGVVKI